jgi:hypothetical protein
MHLDGGMLIGPRFTHKGIRPPLWKEFIRGPARERKYFLNWRRKDEKAQAGKQQVLRRKYNMAGCIFRGCLILQMVPSAGRGRIARRMKGEPAGKDPIIKADLNGPVANTVWLYQVVIRLETKCCPVKMLLFS